MNIFNIPKHNKYFVERTTRWSGKFLLCKYIYIAFDFISCFKQNLKASQPCDLAADGYGREEKNIYFFFVPNKSTSLVFSFTFCWLIFNKPFVVLAIN